jgi:DNA-binding NarL/FixJ family response regulator
VTLTRELTPDVVLMDLAMPGVNGIEATRSIVQTHPGTAVLILTMAQTDDSLVAALRARARGYLLKEAGRQEISHALRSVAAGQAVFGTGLADRILSRLTEPPRGKASTSTAFPQLTGREIEILDLLARGLSNHAISARLYLSDKTVRNHVSNILTMTGAPDRHAAADMARQAGWAATPAHERTRQPTGPRHDTPRCRRKRHGRPSPRTHLAYAPEPPSGPAAQAHKAARRERRNDRLYSAARRFQLLRSPGPGYTPLAGIGYRQEPADVAGRRTVVRARHGRHACQPPRRAMRRCCALVLPHRCDAR